MAIEIFGDSGSNNATAIAWVPKMPMHKPNECDGTLRKLVGTIGGSVKEYYQIFVRNLNSIIDSSFRCWESLLKGKACFLRENQKLHDQ